MLNFAFKNGDNAQYSIVNMDVICAKYIISHCGFEQEKLKNRTHAD